MSEKPQFQETLPLSQPAGGSRRRRGPSPFLLVYHRSGAATVPLEPGVTLVVGRTAPADFVIDDETLSRRHASFELTPEGTLRVRDLGSTNGTMLHGAPVHDVELGAEQQVVLGGVSISFHVGLAHGGADGAESAIDGHDQFLRRLDAEVRRAKHFRRPFALAMVSTLSGGPIGPMLASLASVLRPIDEVGAYSPQSVEVVLPELDREGADRLARQIVAGTGLRAAVAMFPDAGTSAGTLLDAVRTQLSRCSSQEPFLWVPSAGALQPASVKTAMVAESDAMKRVMGMVDQVAKALIPVLLSGETGSGKEVVARAIHERGPRADGPMVCINCGAIPDQLLESTLFGHEKGAFTGAMQQKQGIFEAAHGGTVLLDEIGELPPAAQAALLRVLEEKRVVRVGGTKEIPIDVRVLAATHRDLEAMCEEGAFRWDLYFRLNALTLSIDPLRKRQGDIVLLAEQFLTQAAANAGRQGLSFDTDALDALVGYAWPGNVRELRNAIERAAVIARTDVIGLDDLPDRVQRGAERAPPRPTPSADVPSGPPVSGDLPSFKEAVQKFEADLIVAALQKTQGSQTHAARQLNMPLRTMIHKMKTYGIRRGDYTAG